MSTPFTAPQIAAAKGEDLDLLTAILVDYPVLADANPPEAGDHDGPEQTERSPRSA